MVMVMVMEIAGEASTVEISATEMAAATPASPAATAFGEGVMGKRNTAEGENRRHGCNFE
jgi:hypothetical protein